MTEPSIKFLHLNVQGGLDLSNERHKNEIRGFLKLRSDIDIFCAQEITVEMAEYLSKTFGFKYVHALMGKGPTDELQKGVAIFSKLTIKDSEVILLSDAPPDYKYGFEKFKCIQVDVEKNDEVFRIITTHFPVEYPGTNVSAFQIETFEKLKEKLKEKGEFLLTGDFNAPRGTIIFDSLTALLKDNIPLEVESTLDPLLHKAGALPYVVDGIFTTSMYEISDLEIHEGLSDHKGITGILIKEVR